MTVVTISSNSILFLKQSSGQFNMKTSIISANVENEKLYSELETLLSNGKLRPDELKAYVAAIERKTKTDIADRILTIRVTTDDLTTIKRKAKAKSLSVSELLRQMIREPQATA